jgi:hypothetical protein
MATKETQEIPDLLSRLAELKHEADGLVARQAALYEQAANGSSDEQVEQAARRLIANKTAVLQQDPQVELRTIGEQLTTNRRAQLILSKSLGLLELREGHRAALPAFQRAAAHIPKLAALLAALEAEQAAATRDLRTFEAVDPTGLAAQHPEEKAPYAEAQLGVLRTWSVELVGDGFNRSRLDLWREECAYLGLTLKA